MGSMWRERDGRLGLNAKLLAGAALALVFVALIK